MNQAQIPSHVPKDLIRDFNYAALQGGSDVYLQIKKLHEGPDIFYTPSYGGHWVVTRYADMSHILMNADSFCSRHESIPVQPVNLPLLESDGDLHNDYRELLMPFFKPKIIKKLELRAAELTNTLIDNFYAQGECEFVQEFALKMPNMITMQLLGLPWEDSSYLVKKVDIMLRTSDPTIHAQTYQDIIGYLAKNVIENRRMNPGDDMISAIVHGKIEGGRALRDDEMLGLIMVLLLGGLDTVANMLGLIVMFLATNPEHRKQLVDNPGLIPDALEELLRRFHLPNFAREVVHDIDYKGITFKQGDLIMTPLLLAGIDEHQFPDPMTVDFSREGKKKHIAFGRGRHQCIGIMLARAELRAFLSTWLERIPNFEIKSGEKPIIVPGKVTAVRSLHLSW